MTINRVNQMRYSQQNMTLKLSKAKMKSQNGNCGKERTDISKGILQMNDDQQAFTRNCKEQKGNVFRSTSSPYFLFYPEFPYLDLKLLCYYLKNIFIHYNLITLSLSTTPP